MLIKKDKIIQRYEPYGKSADWYNHHNLDGQLSTFF